MVCGTRARRLCPFDPRYFEAGARLGQKNEIGGPIPIQLFIIMTDTPKGFIPEGSEQTSCGTKRTEQPEIFPSAPNETRASLVAAARARLANAREMMKSKQYKGAIAEQRLALLELLKPDLNTDEIIELINNLCTGGTKLAAQQLGRIRGKTMSIGDRRRAGQARAKQMTREDRQLAGIKGSQARWGNRPKKDK